MAIKVSLDQQANAILFQGSSLATYWNGILSASAGDETGTVNIINTAATSGSNTIYEYYEIPYTDFQDGDGNGFGSVALAVKHINDTANRPSPLGGFETNQSNVFINGDTLNYEVLAGVSQSIFLTGSTNDFNTYVNADIPGNLYSTSSGLFHFADLESRDVLNLEFAYRINTDVADTGHSIKLEFTDNTGVVFDKTLTQTAVEPADEDVEFISIVPFYIGDNLITHPSTGVTASAELFFVPEEDATIKVKNITMYLNR